MGRFEPLLAHDHRGRAGHGSPCRSKLSSRCRMFFPRRLSASADAPTTVRSKASSNSLSASGRPSEVIFPVELELIERSKVTLSDDCGLLHVGWNAAAVQRGGS